MSVSSGLRLLNKNDVLSVVTATSPVGGQVQVSGDAPLPFSLNHITLNTTYNVTVIVKPSTTDRAINLVRLAFGQGNIVGTGITLEKIEVDGRPIFEEVIQFNPTTSPKLLFGAETSITPLTLEKLDLPGSIPVTSFIEIDYVIITAGSGQSFDVNAWIFESTQSPQFPFTRPAPQPSLLSNLVPGGGGRRT